MRHFREAGTDEGMGRAGMELNGEQEEEFWGAGSAEERREGRTKERDGLWHWADKHTFIGEKKLTLSCLLLKISIGCFFFTPLSPCSKRFDTHSAVVRHLSSEQRSVFWLFWIIYCAVGFQEATAGFRKIFINIQKLLPQQQQPNIKMKEAHFAVWMLTRCDRCALEVLHKGQLLLYVFMTKCMW